MLGSLSEGAQAEVKQREMLSREIHKHDRLSLYLLNGGGGLVHDLEDCLAEVKTFLLCNVVTFWQLLG